MIMLTWQMTETEGLLGFADFRDMVAAVAKILRIPKDDVYERLIWEAMRTGWNTRRALEEFGATPFVYNDCMEQLYERTDAFVFELLVWHLRPLCQEWDKRVIQEITAQFKDRRDIEILVLGDGIGTHSLKLATIGYRVCYFELGGPAATLAQYRFRRCDQEHHIKVIQKPAEIPTKGFDVIVCLEVLEHVSDPPEIVANIWRYLKPEGIAIITEGFGAVEPQYPTHLEKNLKYNGKTAELFVHAGFRVLKIYPDEKPFVFQKTDKEDLFRFATLRRAQKHRRLGLIKPVGKIPARAIAAIVFGCRRLLELIQSVGNRIFLYLPF